MMAVMTTKTGRTYKAARTTVNETEGKRIAQLRKERGYTQKELAERMDIPWTLVSDYERGKLRINGNVLKKFASALEVTADEILGLKSGKTTNHKYSLKIIRRLQKIEELPASKQKALLTTIDSFLKGEGKK